MTIRGIGTDIVDLRRIRRARHLERVAEFILRTEEMDAFRKTSDQARFLGSRLAAKEAVIKAFPGVLGYHDFAIGKSGPKPDVRFADTRHTGYSVLVSLTHEKDTAVGFALLCDL